MNKNVKNIYFKKIYIDVLENKLIKKIIKFFLLWLGSYWINLLITLVCREYFNLSSEKSYFITMVFLIIFNFYMSLKIIFKSKFSFKILFQYLFILISFSLLNYYSVIYLKNYFWEEYFYLVIIFVITILSIIKFVIYNNFVFNKIKKW